jgi:hypothetical protein
LFRKIGWTLMLRKMVQEKAYDTFLAEPFATNSMLRTKFMDLSLVELGPFGEPEENVVVGAPDIDFGKTPDWVVSPADLDGITALNGVDVAAHATSPAREAIEEGNGLGTPNGHDASDGQLSENQANAFS